MPKPARWMRPASLKALLEAGIPYSEIIEANWRAVGDRPDPASVSRKARELGIPPRRPTYGDLLPRKWGIKREHRGHWARRGLSALGAHLAGKELSAPQYSEMRILLDYLFTVGGHRLVVCYDRHSAQGFYFADWQDTDHDFIRPPVNNHELAALPDRGEDRIVKPA